jgi:hypothetical protein
MSFKNNNPTCTCCNCQLCITVTSECTGQRRQGVNVHVTNASDEIVGSATTDIQGLACLTLTKEGTYTITASGSGCRQGRKTVTIKNCDGTTAVGLALRCSPLPVDSLRVQACGWVSGAQVVLSQNGSTFFTGTTDLDGYVTYERTDDSPVSYVVSAEYCVTRSGTLPVPQHCQSQANVVGLSLTSDYCCVLANPPPRSWPVGVLPRILLITGGLGSGTLGIPEACSYTGTIVGSTEHTEDVFDVECLGRIGYSIAGCSPCASLEPIGQSMLAYSWSRTVQTARTACAYALQFMNGTETTIDVKVVATWQFAQWHTMDWESNGLCCCNGANCLAIPLMPPGATGSPCTNANCGDDSGITLTCTGHPVFGCTCTGPPRNLRICRYYCGYDAGSSCTAPRVGSFGNYVASACIRTTIPLSMLTPTTFSVSGALAADDVAGACAGTAIWKFTGEPDNSTEPVWTPPPPGGNSVTVSV